MSQAALSRDSSIAVFRCAKALEMDAERHAVAVTEGIDRAIDEFDHTQAFTAHTLAATRSSFHAFCSLLRVEEPFEFHAPPEAGAIARAYVRRGIPLKVLIKCYQVGHAEMWRAWQGVVREQALSPELELEVLDRSSQVLFGLIERLVADVMTVYEVERRKWSRSMSEIRQATVKQLLAGEAIDLEKAEQALAYNLRLAQLGLVLWTVDGSGRAEDLEATWRSLVDACGVRSSTAIVVGSSVLWGWMSGREEDLQDVLPSSALWQPEEGIQVAAGNSGRAVEGFRTSHFEAMQARRVAETGGTSVPLVRFSDVAVPALITADPRLAGIFADGILGPLDGPDKLATRLRETLEAYFLERESPGGTARRLGVHVNTVLYRLKQAEEALGVVPSERRLELELALLLRRYVPKSTTVDP